MLGHWLNVVNIIYHRLGKAEPMGSVECITFHHHILVAFCEAVKNVAFIALDGIETPYRAGD